MPRILAIDWDDRELRIVSANIQAGKANIDDAASVRFRENETESPASIGKRIAEVIAEKRFKANEALVGVGRSQVELRTITLPPVPENEIPDLVRFQSLKEFSEISDHWPIDFLPVHVHEQESTAKVAAISPARVDAVQKTLAAAELKPVGLMLRPTASTVIASGQPDEIILIIDDLECVAELTVVRGDEIQLMRTVNLPEGDAARNVSLLNEVRRTLMASSNKPNLAIDRVVLFGKEQEHHALCDEITEKLKLKTSHIDPFKDASSRKIGEESGRFATAVGMLLDFANEKNRTIDFLNPRRKPVPPSRRSLFAVLGTVAALALIAAGGTIYWQLASKDEQAKELQRELQSLEPKVTQASEQEQDFKAVDAWMSSNVVWINELDYLSRNLLRPDQVRLRSFLGSIQANGNVNIDLMGLMNERSTVTALEKGLVGREKTGVVPGEVNFEGKDPRYPWRFKESITIDNGVVQPKKNQSRISRGRSVIQREQS